MNLTATTAYIDHQVKRRSAVHSTLSILFLGDTLVIFAACVLAVFCSYSIFGGQSLVETMATLKTYHFHIKLAVLSCCTLLWFRHSYDLEQLTRARYGALRMLNSAFYWAVIFVSISLFFSIQPPVSRLWVALSGLLIGLGLASWRYLFCRYAIGQSLLQSTRQTALIVGWNDQARQFYERSKDADNTGTFFPFAIRSCVILETENNNDISDYPAKIYRGKDFASIQTALKTGDHDALIVADTDVTQADMVRLQEICGREMVDFMVMPSFIHTLSSCLKIESFSGLPLLTQNQREVSKRGNLILKRTFDIAGALFGLAIFTPVIAFFAWRVHRESPGPVFYKQVRTGQDGRLFEIIKIRSMRLDAEASSGAKWCTENDPRRLKIGAFMRQYNIDELPQFWNVLKGDMSLVGPRPERPELIKEFKHQIRFYNVRHTVKPGITGWAQINGWRGDTCLNSRIATDLEYIERWTPWFDFYICLRTVFATKNAY